MNFTAGGAAQTVDNFYIQVGRASRPLVAAQGANRCAQTNPALQATPAFSALRNVTSYLTFTVRAMACAYRQAPTYAVRQDCPAWTAVPTMPALVGGATLTLNNLGVTTFSHFPGLKYAVGITIRVRAVRTGAARACARAPGPSRLFVAM